MKVLKFRSLNGLRAISILMVIFYHLQIHGGIFDSWVNKMWLAPFLSFIHDGQLGVNIFFVISGFLITSLLLNEEQQTGEISIKNFYMRRIIRIFPAYYFLLFVYFILQSINILDISPSSWLTAITYTKYFHAPKDWYTMHIWSLSVEEHFYLFWPLIFILGNKSRKFSAFFLIILVPIIKTYTHFYPVVWINDLTIFYRVDAIATGCIFSLYQKEIITFLEKQWSVIFYLSIFGIFFLRYLPRIGHILHIDFIFIPLGNDTTGTLANILIGLILFYSVFGPDKLWSKFLNLPLLNHIGLLSYSIYLWQQFFIFSTPYWFNQFPYYIVYIIIIAHFSYYIIEKPFLKLKKKFKPVETSVN